MSFDASNQSWLRDRDFYLGDLYKYHLQWICTESQQDECLIKKKKERKKKKNWIGDWTNIFFFSLNNVSEDITESVTIKVSGSIKVTFYYSIRIVLLRFCLCTIYGKFSCLHLRYVDDDPTPCPIVTQTRQRIAYVTRSMTDITIINHTLGAPCSHTTFIIYYARSFNTWNRFGNCVTGTQSRHSF